MRRRLAAATGFIVAMFLACGGGQSESTTSDQNVVVRPPELATCTPPSDAPAYPEPDDPVQRDFVDGAQAALSVRPPAYPPSEERLGAWWADELSPWLNELVEAVEGRGVLIIADTPERGPLAGLYAYLFDVAIAHMVNAPATSVMRSRLDASFHEMVSAAGAAYEVCARTVSEWQSFCRRRWDSVFACSRRWAQLKERGL